MSDRLILIALTSTRSPAPPAAQRPPPVAASLLDSLGEAPYDA